MLQLVKGVRRFKAALEERSIDTVVDFTSNYIHK